MHCTENFNFTSVKPIISLNNGLESDDDLYSDEEADKTGEISMRCDTQEEEEPSFEVPMTPVPNKKQKTTVATITSPSEERAVESYEKESTPKRSLPRKRKPAVEPELNVRGQKGYSTYPAHLFDVPPACLNIDLLRRKYLISEISKSRAEEMFYNRWVSFLNFVTESVRTIAEENGWKINRKESNADDVDDHDYCISQPSLSSNTSTVKAKL